MHTFIFDLGGVLLDVNLRRLVDCLAGGDPERCRRLWALGDDPTLVELETGRISGRDYFERCVRPIVPYLSYGDFVRTWEGTFSPNRDGGSLFSEVRKRGLAACILSNISEYHVSIVEQRFPEVLAAADACFFSCRLGCVKPQPEIYLRVCEALNATPASCIFLDDTAACVDGARRVGMRALHFVPENLSAIRIEVRTLIERAGGRTEDGVWP